ncbi:MAG TPA: phosphotransferase, partial [Herpetosiphonaceae bacterium]
EIDAPLQLIHRDYRSANLLWADGRLAAVLDWEEVGWGHRARDVAWAAVHLATRYHDWGPLAPLAQHHFIAAYEEANPLSEAERAALPALLVWAGLGLVQATLGKPAEPEAMAALERSVARFPAASRRAD